MAASRLPEVISNPPTARIVSDPEDGEKDDLLELAEIGALDHLLAYRNVMIVATSPEWSNPCSLIEWDSPDGLFSGNPLTHLRGRGGSPMRRPRLAGGTSFWPFSKEGAGCAPITEEPPHTPESVSVARRHLSSPPVGIPGQWAGLRTGHFHPGMERLGLSNPSASPLNP